MVLMRCSVGTTETTSLSFVFDWHLLVVVDYDETTVLRCIDVSVYVKIISVDDDYNSSVKTLKSPV